MNHRRRPVLWLFVILGGTMVGLSGCVTRGAMAKRLVEAPNRHSPARMKQALDAGDQMLRALQERRLARILRVAIVDPPAGIELMILEPASYEFSSELRMTPAQGREAAQLSFKAKWDVSNVRGALRPNGTVVLLHGFMMSKEAMLVPWGLALAKAGYRVVMVDLRGHGRSTGEWIGFGAWEARDLRSVLDELERRELIAGRVGVLGISYGAAVALQWAASDPRVATVVALAPFSDPRQAIMEFARSAEPKLTRALSDADFQAIEERAARLAGFRWSDADVLAATRRLRAPVLFVHGRRDDWIPPAHSEVLFLAAPTGSRRETPAEDNHLTIGLRFDETGQLVTSWFRERLQSP